MENERIFLDDIILLQRTMPVGKYDVTLACWRPACGLRSGFRCRFANWKVNRRTKSVAEQRPRRKPAGWKRCDRELTCQVLLESAGVLEKRAPSSLKWPSRSPTVLSPSLPYLSGRHGLTIPGLLCYSGFGMVPFQSLQGAKWEWHVAIRREKLFIRCWFCHT